MAEIIPNESVQGEKGSAGSFHLMFFRPRNKLFKDYMRFVEEFEPKLTIRPQDNP